MTEQSPVERIFFAALEKSTAEERVAYLDAACGDDGNLRRRVERLLAAHPRLGHFLEPLAQGEVGLPDAVTLPPNEKSDSGSVVGSAIFSGGPSEGVGSVIAGRYKLVESLGQGGMGAVFMAQQTKPVKRLVALKLIKLGMDSRQVLARFDAERQALALMDHPNIAKVLEAGATESGRPFFVMELVKGVPITRFCDERQLSPRERLELFIPVCQAIQHAHQKGVIHRDIKPTNVLVALYDDRPVPKVIDFGVAKATGSQLTDASLVTGFGAIVGTPEYMSPEQAQLNQLDIDTRSDVYALGVLLYELLTGTTPIDRKRLGQDALLEILRVIREEEPPRPSVRLSTSEALASIAATRKTEPAKLTKLMRGELDWIVMKCLEKERSRRYETANGLARDLEHYLHDEPVEACPPSLRYQLRKLLRRNKRPVVAAGLVLLALVVGIIGTSWGLVRAEKARQFAQAKEQEAVTEKARAVAAAEEEKKARDDAVKAQGAEAAERKKAEDERDAKAKALVRAQGLRLTAQSSAELHTDPGLGLLLAIEAARISPSKEANDALLSALDTCREERTLFMGGEVLSARFAPDGKKIMSCAKNGTVRMWDAENGRQLFATPAIGHVRGIMADTLLSPDGEYVVTLYSGTAFFDQRGGRRLQYTDRVARVWAAATGKQLAVLRGHKNRIGRAAFRADSKRLVTASEDAVRVWEIPSGKQLAVFEGHASTPCSARFSHDGHQVLTISSGWFPQKPSGAISPPAAESDPEEIRVPASASGGRYFSLGPSFSPFNERENTLARVWDVETGREVARIVKPKGFLGAQREVPSFGHFSPDGKRVALGIGNAVQVWDVAAGKMQFEVQHGGISLEDHAAWSPDSKRLATIRGNYVSIWDAAHPKELTSLRGHDGTVRTVSFGPDGKLMLTTSVDRTARVWNAETGEQVAVLRGHKSWVDSADLSPDGRRVVTAAELTVRVWWLEPPKNHTRPLAVPDVNSSAIALSPDGKYLAAGSNYSRSPGPLICDTATGNLVHRLKPLREGIVAKLPNRDSIAEVHDVAFSPDGRRLLSIVNEEQIRIRKGGVPPAIPFFLAKPKPPSDDPNALGNQGETLPFTPARIWDVETGKQLLALKAGEVSFSCARFSPDGRKVIAGESDRKRYAVYSSTGMMISSGSLGVNGVAFARVYDATTGKELLKLPHEGPLVRAEFRPDGRKILAAASTGRSRDKDIKMWDGESGTLFFGLDSSGYDDVACFAPDGTRIVLSFFNEIHVHDAESGKELARYPGHLFSDRSHEERRFAVHPFSPDAKKLLAYGKDGLGLLDVRTGKQLVAFRYRESGVNSALFSVDGRFVVTASSGDQTARVWDAATGEELYTLRHKSGVRFAVMSPDNRFVVTASDTVRIWQLDLLSEAVRRKPRELSPDERAQYGIK